MNTALESLFSSRCERHEGRAALPKGLAQLFEDPQGLLAPVAAVGAHLVHGPRDVHLHQRVQDHLGSSK